MDSQQFREFGITAIDVIANYYENIRERKVIPSLEPGDLIQALPDIAPESPEEWKNLIEDFSDKILPAITHWHSPQFHSYFPSGISHASIIGSLICNGLGTRGLSWLANPACTELEVVVMNWLAKLMGLPEYFLNSSSGPGGGVLQGSASEATLVCLLAAKNKILENVKREDRHFNEDNMKTRLVMYTSDQANSSVEKAGILGSMKIRLLKSYDLNGQLRKETLKKAFEEDKSKGLIPCYVVACLGTTSTCAIDPLDELGPVCREEGVWLHVDAAYAGAALICTEYRHFLKGIEYVDSFVFNPHKWFLVNFECSALWVKDCFSLIKTFDIKRVVDTINNESETLIPNYRYWQIPLGRQFRALKLWFVLKINGVVGIRKYIRTHVNLANYFATLIRSDNRAIIEPEPSLGVVCFRLRNSDALTQKLLEYLISTKKIFLIATMFRNHYTIRFVICSIVMTKEDVENSWNIIQDGMDHILSKKVKSSEIYEKSYFELKHSSLSELEII